MFVAWARKPLSETGSRRYTWGHEFGEACACAPTGLGREKLTPVVRRAFRVDGRPRSEVIARPADGIRRCCVENAADPLGRVAFWRSFWQRRADFLEELCDDSPRLLVELYVHRSTWLRDEIAKTVPLPTADEEALFDLFVWPGDTFDPATMVEDRLEALAKARERLEAYKWGRRRGEAPREWWRRSEAEREAAEAKRRAEEWERRRKVWAAWIISPPGTPPPAPSVPPDWQRLRDAWLEGEAAYRAGGTRWQAGPAATLGGLAAAAAALGLCWPCTADEAKAAYRRAASEHHPDRNRGDEAAATERMKRVNLAYDELKKNLRVA